MILPFKEYFDSAKTKPTYFREKILLGADRIWQKRYDPQELESGPEGPSNKTWKAQYVGVAANIKPKIHTIRAGHRWKKGDLMHMCYGHRTKNYHQFNKGIPELERVKDVQEIRIKYYGLTKKNSVHISIDGQIFYWGEIIDSGFAPSGNEEMRPLYAKNICKLAINDGFDSANNFFSWFSKDFSGQIIHFTDNIRY